MRGCGALSWSSAALAIPRTFPTGGLQLTASILGQTLIVPFTRTLPVVGAVWQSIVTATGVVADATTLNDVEAPEQLVFPSTEVPVSVRAYPVPAAMLPMTEETDDEPVTLIDPLRRCPDR